MLFQSRRPAVFARRRRGLTATVWSQRRLPFRPAPRRAQRSSGALLCQWLLNTSGPRQRWSAFELTGTYQEYTSRLAGRLALQALLAPVAPLALLVPLLLLAPLTPLTLLVLPAPRTVLQGFKNGLCADASL